MAVSLEDRMRESKYFDRDVKPLELALDAILGDPDDKKSMPDPHWLNTATTAKQHKFCLLIIARSLAKLAYAFERECQTSVDRERGPITLLGALEEIVISLRAIDERLDSIEINSRN